MAKKVAKTSARTTAAAAMLLTALFALCGCQSDRYYQARAAERAREYLLENAPELSPDQEAYVKYNDPVLLVGEGLKGRERGIMQICVTWDIPGAKNLYMVFGAGRSRMDDWYPNRLIRKNFVSPDKNIGSAISTCRGYAITNFYEVLSKADLNIVRLSDPEIAETGFEPRPDSAGKVPDTTQISLQWKISGNRYVVFCGYSPKADLAGWKLNFAAIMPDYEANFVRGKIIRQPNDFNTPIIVPEKEDASGNTGAAVEKKNSPAALQQNTAAKQQEK